MLWTDDDDPFRDRIENHQFFSDAAAHGLFDTKTSGLTIFLPLRYKTIDDEDDEFEEFFNRHVVEGHVVLDDGVKQVTTLSQVVFGVYALSESEFAVGGVTFGCDMVNYYYQDCTVHAFESTSLPTLRPLHRHIDDMRITYLGGEVIQMGFEELGIESKDAGRPSTTLTLFACFTESDRTLISDVQKTSWEGRGTTAQLLVPEVASSRDDIMLWMNVYDNSRRHPIISMVWPWKLLLIPNIEMRSNLDITHVVPKKAKEDEEAAIFGSNFPQKDLRVFIGGSPAQVIVSEHNYIRIFIPRCSDPTHPHQPIWVANGNVYKRYDFFTYKQE